jgi:hypothetical protein
MGKTCLELAEDVEEKRAEGIGTVYSFSLGIHLSSLAAAWWPRPWAVNSWVMCLPLFMEQQVQYIS